MNLCDYETLTGTTVAESAKKLTLAQIRRTTSMLETMLGYTLSPDLAKTNIYKELGKTTRDCFCPQSFDEDDLLPADTVTGSYRLFDYNPNDVFHLIDPYKTVYKAKLVYTKTGSGDTGITIRTFDDDQIRVHTNNEGFGKYLEHCKECLCRCEDNCVQLAVDADWLWGEDDELPVDLQYVLADMVTYYSDSKRNIRSESITTHSYTKFDNVAPEMEPTNIAIIKKYAGQRGSVMVMPV